MKHKSHCHMIGLEPQEIDWVRLLVDLLRSPDPMIPELARQALEYVHSVAEPSAQHAVQAAAAAPNAL